MTKRYRDEDWLYRKYHIDGLNQQEIAEICDVGDITISRWMERHDILTEYDDKKYRDADWLEQKYSVEGLNQQEIAKICGVKDGTISNWMDKHDIDIKYDKKKYRDADWLREKYVDEELSIRDIAEICNVTATCISHWLEKFDIEKRTLSEALTGRELPSGEDHWSWRGGGGEGYGENWNHQRNKALRRADYACENPDCDEDKESIGRNPDIHHIVPFRLYGEENYKEANSLDNLIALCRQCHNDVEPSQDCYHEIGKQQPVIDMKMNKRAGYA